MIFFLNFLGVTTVSSQGNILGWLESFLTQWKQCVVLDGKISSTLDVTSRVPQGTVIGPPCFLVYINDMPGTKTRLFADDAFVYRELNCPEDSPGLGCQSDEAARVAVKRH